MHIAKTAADKLFNNPKAEINSQDYIQYGELLQDLGQDTLAVDMVKHQGVVGHTGYNLLNRGKSLVCCVESNAKMYDKAADIMAKYIDGEGDNANPNDILALYDSG